VATVIESAKSLGFISVPEVKVYQLDSKDPLAQLRSLVAITEVDELSLENNEDAYAHRALARMMTPIRLEALRLFDQYQAEHAAESEQLLSRLTRVTANVRRECNDVSVCLEILTRIATPAVLESKIDLEPAKEFLRKRKEAIRSQLRTWVDSVSAQSTAQLELLPEETRTQMMEDLRDFADLLAESSTQGLILFSSESLDFQNPFMDRGSELLLSGDTRLFRARTEFFRRGGLKTSLDYPLN